MSKPLHCSSLVVPSALAIAVPMALMVQPSAQALSFRFDFAGNVSHDFQVATQEAADLWSSHLKDDAIIDLRIEYTDLSIVGGSVLGGAQPARVKVSYESYVDALFKDAVSSNDLAGISSLQLSSEGRQDIQAFQAGSRSARDVQLESKEFAFLMDGKFTPEHNNRVPQPNFIDNNGSNNNKHVLLTRAQAKALDLLDARQRGLDAIIKINSDVDWDLDPHDGVKPGHYDVSSVLQHEIGHALGIVSGVDAFDFLATSNEPVDIENNAFSYLTPMDFYRYSAESAEMGVMDLTLGGGEKYFSLDRGRSAITDESGQAAYFSTGSLSSGGNGYQGSHWRETGDHALGITDPSLDKGHSHSISQLDLTLLDVVGWDLEDRLSERATAIGINWSQLTETLALARSVVIEQALSTWESKIPGLEAAMNDASSDIDLSFRHELQKLFDELEEELVEEDEQSERNEAYDEFYQKVSEVSDKRSEELRKLPAEIYKLDQDVSQWLSLSVDDLAKELQQAEALEINRLSNVVKAAPVGERARLEPKLAEALSRFHDKPNELVQELLDTSGPTNPIGFGTAKNWSFWFQFAEEGQLSSYQNEASMAVGLDNMGLENIVLHSVATPSVHHTSELGMPHSQRSSKEVPEPSSVLALLGMGVIGMGMMGGKKPRFSK